MLENTSIQKTLRRYKNQGLLRTLEELDEEAIDFFSNDYLGIARSANVYKHFIDKLQKHTSNLKLGSTGSRLIGGNLTLFRKLEQEIAEFHRAESGLIFNSGYNANIGIFSSIPVKGDVILFDFLSHASIRDGIRLSFADSYSFKHNDTDDLEKKLKKFQTSRRGIYVGIESLYSMDGDIAPIEEILTLCKKYKAHLIVDEAHSSGVIGECGEGLVAQLGLEDDIFVRVHTFGKALGCHGAIVLGSELLKNFLVTKARTFIYTTALGNYDTLAIQCAYEYLKKNTQLIKKLHKNIDLFKSLLPEKLKKNFLPVDSHIQSFILNDIQKIKQIETAVKKNRINVKAILYPTVPEGTERIRISLHAFNTGQEMSKLIRILSEFVGV